jgi:peptidoglycan/LPS O-acetylase OafA/YrhL
MKYFLTLLSFLVLGGFCEYLSEEGDGLWFLWFALSLLIIPGVWGFWGGIKETDLEKKKIKNIVLRGSHILGYFFAIGLSAAITDFEELAKDNEWLLVIWFLGFQVIISLFFFFTSYAMTIAIRRYFTPIKPPTANKALERNSEPLRSQNPSV